MNTTHRHTNRRLALCAAFACCLTAALLTDQAGVAQAQIRVRVPGGGGKGKSEASVLSEAGPQFLADYLLSNFSARVFTRGGAPMVFEYQLGHGGTATVTLAARVGKEEQSFTRRLEPTGDEIREVVFRLPEAFGEKPVVATLSVKAENTNEADKGPPAFEVYGIGMGEKAVGSILIERLSFQPVRVRATQQERAAYGFHSRSDFPAAGVEFRLLWHRADGKLMNSLVNSKKLGGVRRGESVSREWDGRNGKREVSKGRHQLLVKAWYGEKKGGDWAAARSRQRVLVE
ncbi:MAG: hypothetical protein M3416_15510 [Acidobacteriota bacterium]|nr:hypothetical protein [Acidobacteriota bacterium]